MFVEMLFWPGGTAVDVAQVSETVQHVRFRSMALSGRMLAVVLHGVLGSQNERRETGQRLRQLQERMLTDVVKKTEPS